MHIDLKSLQVLVAKQQHKCTSLIIRGQLSCVHGPVSNIVYREHLPNTIGTVIPIPSLKLVWSHDHRVDNMLNVSDDVCSN